MENGTATTNGLRLYWSEMIDKFAPAMVKLQGKLSPVKKDKENSHFKSQYADMNGCVEASKEALAECGFAVIQTPRRDATGPYLSTMVLHESGQWFIGEYPLIPNKNDPQSLASAITYAKRNTYCAMLRLTAEGDDDDGNGASAGNNNQNRNGQPSNNGQQQRQPQNNGQPNGQQQQPSAQLTMIRDGICKHLRESTSAQDCRSRWENDRVQSDVMACKGDKRIYDIIIRHRNEVYRDFMVKAVKACANDQALKDLFLSPMFQADLADIAMDKPLHESVIRAKDEMKSKLANAQPANQANNGYSQPANNNNNDIPYDQPTPVTSTENLAPADPIPF